MHLEDTGGPVVRKGTASALHTRTPRSKNNGNGNGNGETRATAALPWGRRDPGPPPF